jgi:hypothetical protein
MVKEILREWQEFQRQVLVEEVSSNYDWVGMQYGDVVKQLRAAGVKSLKGKWWKQFKRNHPVRVKYRQWWKSRKNPVDNIGIPVPTAQHGLTPMQTRRLQLKNYTPDQLKDDPDLAIQPPGTGIETPSPDQQPANYAMAMPKREPRVDKDPTSKTPAAKPAAAPRRPTKEGEIITKPVRVNGQMRFVASAHKGGKQYKSKPSSSIVVAKNDVRTQMAAGG